MSKKIWWLVACAILIVVLLPLGIDWLIIGNNFPSNISNSDWVGFFGGYIGAILGCVISLIGILWTINFTREQNRADRELQIRPFFDIRYLDVEQFCCTKNWLGYVTISTWDKDGNDSDTPNAGPVGAGLLYLKNVGSGPATNLNFQVEIENIKCEYNARYTNQNTKVTTNAILPGGTAELSIDITNSREAPKKEDFVWSEDSPFADYDMAKFKIPERFTIKLRLCYADLMANHFTQELVFNVYYYMKSARGEDAQYRCELHLDQIGIPLITRAKK